MLVITQEKEGRRGTAPLYTYFYVSYNKAKKPGVSMSHMRKLRIVGNGKRRGPVPLPPDPKALAFVPLTVGFMLKTQQIDHARH